MQKEGSPVNTLALNRECQQQSWVLWRQDDKILEWEEPEQLELLRLENSGSLRDAGSHQEPE